MNCNNDRGTMDGSRRPEGAMVSRAHPLAHRRRQSRISTELADSPGEPSPAYQATPPSSSIKTVKVKSRFSTKIVHSTSGTPPEYSPPTSRPHSPIDIPELLQLIGQRIPLWVLDPYIEVYRFCPRTLVRCSSVSKLWHKVMTPLIWYLFDDSQQLKIPVEVLTRNAHWIRILERHHRFTDLGSILIDDDDDTFKSQSYSSLPQSNRLLSSTLSTSMNYSPQSTTSRWRHPWRRSHQNSPEMILKQGKQQPSLLEIEKELPMKQSAPRAVPPRTTTRTYSGMVLLKQLTCSSWVPGMDKVLRLNPNLGRLTWQGANVHRNVPAEIWNILNGDIALSSTPSPIVVSPFQRLRELQFKRFSLDARVFFPVLAKLPSLRILIFTDVVLLNMNYVRPFNANAKSAVDGVSTSGPQQLATIPSFQFHQIREIQFGAGLQKSGGLEGLVRYCPYLMRLVLESGFDAWLGGGIIFHNHLHSSNLTMLSHCVSPPAPTATAPKQDTFVVLVQTLKQSCPRLRSMEYMALKTRAEGTPLLSDEQAYMFAQCLEVGAARALPKQFIGFGGSAESQQSRNQAEQEAIREADEQDRKELAAIQASSSDGRVATDNLPSYFKVDFKADLLRLDHLTSLALCQASMTLQSISLFLFQGTVGGEDDKICNSLRNALQILTTCQGLRSFKLEFDYQNSTSQPIALATYRRDLPNPLHQTPVAWGLFNAPWSCLGLETLVLSGIKRSIYLDRKNITSEVVYAFRNHGSGNQFFVPVKMRELLAIATTKDADLSIYNNVATESDLPVGGPTLGLRQFQQIMFAQLARLSELKELSLNGFSFREFSKVQQIVHHASR